MHHFLFWIFSLCIASAVFPQQQFYPPILPQIPLPPKVQQSILQELPAPDLLRKSLDVVDTVLGFLSSSGGKPNASLEGYLKKLKMGDKNFSEKVNICCLPVFQFK